MSQNSVVLRHLKRNRPITSLQALNLYGIFRLAARVQNLRDKGHQLITTPIHRGSKVFASYSLEQSK